MPRADAFAIRAWRHILRDLEIRVKVPHARVINAEYHKVIWPDLIDVRLVRHGQRATAEVVTTVSVELFNGLMGARVIRIVVIADVTARICRVIGRRALVASHLDHSLVSNSHFHDIIRVRGVWDVTVHPPSFEAQVRKRVLWASRDHGLALVKTVHTGVPHG